MRFREKKKSDATLKLRGPDGCIDVAAWRERTDNADTKIEGDWAGERRLVSASMDGELDDAARSELAKPKPSVVRLLTGEQRRLAHELMVPLAQVDLLGPIKAMKWEPEREGDVAAELWDVGPELRFLELSVLVTADPAGALEALEKRVVDAGLKLEPLQDTKTSTVLRHLETAG